MEKVKVVKKGRYLMLVDSNNNPIGRQSDLIIENSVDSDHEVTVTVKFKLKLEELLPILEID